MGEVGISLTDPDHYALDVLNDILNSFGGKLFDQIRSREVRIRAHTSLNPELNPMIWDMETQRPRVGTAFESLSPTVGEHVLSIVCSTHCVQYRLYSSAR